MKSKLISTIGIIIVSFIGSALAAPLTQLTLLKEVNGGEATAAEWVLTADGTGDNDLSGEGAATGFVDPDTFHLSESTGPRSYTAGDWDCIGDGILDGQSLTLSEGDAATCTIINTFVPPVVIFDTDFALPAMPIGDGEGTPVCIGLPSGLLVAGCDVTITADQIDPSSVQRRVNYSCIAGSSIRVINTDGSVVCESDTDSVLSEVQVDSYVANNGYSTGAHVNEATVDVWANNNGYGDITAVTTAAGSGLTGGSSSGSVALSVSGVTSAMIANGTITGTDIDTSTTVTAADFAYSSAKTYYRYYGASAFKVGDGNGMPASSVRHSAIHDFFYAPAAQSSTYFQAPLDIPNGATITGMTCYRYDNDETNNQTNYVAVRERDLTSISSGSPDVVVASSTTSGASSSIQSISSTGTLTIDYNASAYWLYMYSSDFGGSANVRFYGCRLAFTLSTVSN